MRFSEYYHGLVGAARTGNPTAREAQHDYRRDLDARIQILRLR